MEGRQDEYLASRAPKPIAHITEIEEQQLESEENVTIADEDTLNNEFAALSLGTLLRISFFLRFTERFVSLCCSFICRTDTCVEYSFILCFTFCFTCRFTIVSYIVSTIYMFERIVYIVDTELYSSLASL